MFCSMCKLYGLSKQNLQHINMCNVMRTIYAMISLEEFSLATAHVRVLVCIIFNEYFAIEYAQRKYLLLRKIHAPKQIK